MRWGLLFIIVAGGWANTVQFSDELLQLYKQQERRHESYFCPFVQVYDTRTDTWRRMPSLLSYATHDIRIAIDGKTVYALAGENVAPATSNTTAWLRIGTILLGD